MAKIQLNEEAAIGVYTQLAASAVELEVPKMSFLEGIESDSKSMDAFTKQAKKLHKMLKSYQKLLAHDVKSLNDACTSTVSADKLAAAALRSNSHGGGR